MSLFSNQGRTKFEAQLQGPYTVESRINNLVYCIVTPERRKKLRQYHVNSMKEWKTPPAVMAVTYCREEADEVLGDGPELYPFERGCKEIESPTLNTQLSTAQQVQAKALFEDVFSNELGNTQLATHSINTGDAKPVYNQPRRVPQAWQAKIREEIHTIFEAEVIEPSTSPWTSPIVPVHKKDGSLHLCIDYRQLNAVTQDDRYQMPRVDEMVERLGRAQFITTLDLAKGYCQVPLKTEDQEKTAFITPLGKFQFRQMPFGLKGAQSTFQRLMDTVLAPCHQFAGSYIDGIIIYSKSWEEHLIHLKEVLQHLREAGLTAKPSKCSIAMFQCVYLGHKVGGGKISLDEAKVAAIQDYKTPRTKKDVRAFLGLTGYYRRFIPGYAQLTAALSDLTKKDVPSKIQWNEDLEHDFQQLKREMVNRPVLMCPDDSKLFILQTDASERGVGVVLSQVDDCGEERPIAFYSKKLLPREQRYAVVEKECLGIVTALKHFDVHLIGRKFVVVTDHKALRYLSTMSNANPRLTCWALAVQPFTFEVMHRPGRSNGNADGLSRQAWSENEEDMTLLDCSAAREGGGGGGGGKCWR